MEAPSILLCGGTGTLGAAVGAHLAAGAIPFRALVRPSSDASSLERLGAEIRRGDLRDPATLRPALTGIGTVISTANAMTRLLQGARDISIRDVDDRGYANLIAASEEADVQRFVYVSALTDLTKAHTPFTDAKSATEARLRAARVREVIVRPDMFQEVWLGPVGGFDLDHDRVTIYGAGVTPHRPVAIDDVAEAVVRLALAADPPREIELAGPEAITPADAARAYEEAMGHRLHVRHVPRLVLRIGRVLARPAKPAIASIMGMTLVGDIERTTVDDGGFRSLGIAATPAHAYIERTARAAAV